MTIRPAVLGRRAAITALVSALVLSGCSGRDDNAATTQPTSGQPTSGFPVTVSNCGVEVTVHQPPKRVVGYYQQTVELLLALGQQNAIVGTVYPDNPPLPEYEAAYKAIPEISNKDASFEQILKVTPDFVYGGYRSAFDETAGRSRKAFSDAGITTFLNQEACATAPLAMEDVYKELRTVARFFSADVRAAKLITKMEASVWQAHRAVSDVPPVNVFVYDSGDQTASTAGGKGIGNQVIKLAGGNNVFADVDSNFTDVSWEQVLQRSPDVIVIYDYFGSPSVESKKNYLRSRPELASVPAIRNNRFVVLNLQDAVLGVRAPFAVATLAKELHPDRF